MENQTSQNPEPTVEKFLEEVEKKEPDTNTAQEKDQFKEKRENDSEFQELAEQEEQKAREAEKFVGSWSIYTASSIN